MNNQPGWIKLYKQTLESDFWLSEDEPFDWRSAFIHVLLSANWRKGTSRKNGHMITIERGQLLTSIRKLMATFHWSRKRVENWIKGMTEYGMLESQSVGFGTVLTVVNYDKFQCDAYTPSNEVSNTVSNAPSNIPSNKPSNEVSNKPSTQYKTIYRSIEDKKEDTILAPSVPTTVCEDAGTGEAGADDDDDEGYMTPDELRQFLESYYREHPIGDGATGCAVQTEG